MHNGNDLNSVENLPNDQPLVSVIIPAYNAKKFVLEALNSVLVQQYRPLEILLIDDGSTDGTSDLVGNTFPMVRVIRQPNSGVAKARNTGIRNAKGEFICLLDADDGWYPEKVEVQIRYLQQHPGVGAVFHAWEVLRPNDRGEYCPPARQLTNGSSTIDASTSGWIYTKLLLDCVIHTSTIMMRKELVDAAGFFRSDLVNGEDYDYWLRASRITRIDKLLGVYSFYRATPGGLTSSVKSINYEYNVVQTALDRWGSGGPDASVLSKRQIGERLGKLAFDFGYAHYLRGDPKQARAALLEAFRHDCLRWKALIFWLATYFKKTG